MKEAEIFINDCWEEVKFSELKKDNRFRIYTPSGEISKNDKGNSVFIATSDSFIKEENQQWTIYFYDDIPEDK
ncbi:MAG TPA: hypothetical protein VIK72_16980 [Clostridiaceae bacterium]